MSVLSVNDIGKAFRTYHSEWQRLGRWFGLQLKPAEENWVLRHISFDIQPGEAIGIVGQNGAGKSTLLKIITGTLQPTEGQIQVNGRISAILELGMGFNPELTGRQNVRHAAGLMGFSPDQIDAAMPDIEAFAEIGEYFDNTVRTYSSGMQMRVAFALATAWRPEILIVDEALSVGDIFFQQKCLERIKAMKENGASLILVSHDSHTVREFTERTLLMDRGKFLLEETSKAIEIYEQQRINSDYNPTNYKKTDNHKESFDSSSKQSLLQGETRQGDVFVNDGTVEFINISITNEWLSEKHIFSYGAIIRFHISLQLKHKLEEPVVGILIKDVLGRDVFCFNTHDYKGVSLDVSEEYLKMFFEIENRLVEGLYFVSIALAEPSNHSSGFHQRYFSHRVSYFYSEMKEPASKFMGICDLRPKPGAIQPVTTIKDKENGI